MPTPRPFFFPSTIKQRLSSSCSVLIAPSCLLAPCLFYSLTSVLLLQLSSAVSHPQNWMRKGSKVQKSNVPMYWQICQRQHALYSQPGGWGEGIEVRRWVLARWLSTRYSPSLLVPWHTSVVSSTHCISARGWLEQHVQTPSCWQAAEIAWRTLSCIIPS